MKGIEWTNETWNPLRGCSRVSAGCENCYAERMATRLKNGAYRGLVRSTSKGPRWSGKVQFVESALDAPRAWRKPRMVFVNSMSDLFHAAVSDAEILRIWDVMRDCHQHTFQCLTKRPERIGEWFRKTGAAPLPNVWVGTSVEDQASADTRIPHLKCVPAAVKFISAEPLLGPLDLTEHLPTLDWVIAGGESGPRARVCQQEWLSSLVDQCAGDTPLFVKQMGAHSMVGAVSRGHASAKGADPAEWHPNLRVQEWPGFGF